MPFPSVFRRTWGGKFLRNANVLWFRAERTNIVFISNKNTLRPHMHPHRGKSLVLRKTQEANLLPQPCWPSPTPLHMTTTPLQSMSQHYSSSHFLPGSIRSIWHVTWFLSVLSSVSFNKWIFLFLFGNSKSMNCLHVTWEKNLSHCNLQLTSTDLTHKNFVLLVWTKIFMFLNI